MNKFNFTFWYRWLVAMSILLILSGLYTSFFKSTSLDGPFRLFIDSVFWKDGSVSSGIMPFGAFVYSVWGAAIVMWGTQLFFVCRFAFKKKELWAWWAILISTLLWFFIAAGFSVYYGAFLNAIGDTVYMLLLVVPLVMTQPIMFPVDKKA